MTCIDCETKGCKQTWDGVCLTCRRTLNSKIEAIRNSSKGRRHERERTTDTA